MRKKTLLAIIVILLLGMLPASNVLADAAIDHPFDNSALLMISANMRMDGEVQSAQGISGHLLVPALQTSSGNEIDVLIDLYSDQIAKLRASDTYSQGQEAKLISQLEDKVDALHKRAQALNDRRSRGRGGLLGWLNRGVKGLGRITGRLVGAVMDGSGKIVEFAIEEVAPRVLKEALESGVPINMALVRRITRELLINRLVDHIAREQQIRRERLANNGDILAPDEQATLAAEADDLADLENSPSSKTEEAANSGGSGSSGTSSEGNITSLDFPLGDENGGIIWAYYWDTYEDTHANANCLVTYGGFDTNQGTLHLEINPDAETISGYAEFSGSISYEGEKPMQFSGSYRVEFSDVPNDPDAVASSSMPVLYYFQGPAYGTGSASGFVTCQTCPNQICGDPYQVSADMVHNQVEGTLQFRIFPPETPDSAIQHWIIGGGTGVDNWYANFYLETDYLP